MVQHQRDIPVKEGYFEIKRHDSKHMLISGPGLCDGTYVLRGFPRLVQGDIYDVEFHLQSKSDDVRTMRCHITNFGVMDFRIQSIRTEDALIEFYTKDGDLLVKGGPIPKDSIVCDIKEDEDSVQITYKAPKMDDSVTLTIRYVKITYEV